MVRMWDKDGLSIPTSMKQTQQESMHEHQVYTPDDHSQTPQKQPTDESKKERNHTVKNTQLWMKRTESFFPQPPPPQNFQKKNPLNLVFYGELPLAFLGDFRCVSNHPHGASRHVARHGARTKPGDWRRIYTQQNEQRKPNPYDIPRWLVYAYFNPYIPG